MLAIHMMEITTLVLHLAPNAVMRAHAQFYTCVYAIGIQYLLCLSDKSIHISLFRDLQFRQLFVYLFILPWTSIAK